MFKILIQYSPLGTIPISIPFPIVWNSKSGAPAPISPSHSSNTETKKPAWLTNTEKYVNSSKENAIQVSAPPSSEVSNSTLSQS